MTTSAVAAITGRIAAIQGRFDQFTQLGSATPSFSELLRMAGAQPEATAAVAPTDPTHGIAAPILGSPDSAPSAQPPAGGQIIGMLGTPVITTGGVATGFHGAFVQPNGDWWTGLPDRGVPWAGAIEDAAHRNGIDPRLLAALVWGESEFTPTAVSHSGAIGLTQLMPATAAGLGVEPTDPIANLDGGARYLADMLREFGTLELGLAAYNAGPGSVRRAQGIPAIPETQAYVPKVLGYYRRLGGLT